MNSTPTGSCANNALQLSGKAWRRLLRRKLTNWFLPVLGLLSLVWFLLRVIPKPSRATYPCQQAAFPAAAGFVLWVVGLLTSLAVFRQARQKLRQARYCAAGLGFAAAIVLLAFSFLSTPSEPSYAANPAFVPDDAPNQPMGQAQGIYPGRVVWVHNPAAIAWDGRSGNWWDEGNTVRAEVGTMISEALQTLTGERTDEASWEALFRSFNARRGKGEVGYQTGERIAIKFNNAQFDTAPQTLLALVNQLTQEAGVAAEQITIYDVPGSFPRAITEAVHAEFPTVSFVGWQGDNVVHQYQRDTDVQIRWSAELTLEIGGGNPTFLPTCVTQADYLINLGNMKGHDLAGVTLCAKNHFGSISADRDGTPYKAGPKAAGLHPYVTAHDYRFGGEWDFDMRPPQTYNPLVDLMGHQHLGDKTLVFMLDALYALQHQNGRPVALNQQWQMAPFDGFWTASIFMSQDGVALESVGVDFLRSEPTQNQIYGTIDNYLHEASLAHAPPSGTRYDPEGDGIPLNSLGVHEHWNNATDKQYSGNLGIPGGIELVRPNRVVTAVEEETDAVLPNTLTLKNYPNPFNASTVLTFELPQASRMQLRLYNTIGQQVVLLRQGYLTAGAHTMVWDGRDQQGNLVHSGLYFVRLTAGSAEAVRKVIMLR